MSDPDIQPEAEPTTVPLEWEGHTFNVAASPSKIHPKVLRAFERGNATDSIEGLIGTKQFDALMDDPSMTMERLNDLMNKVAELWGFANAGE